MIPSPRPLEEETLKLLHAASSALNDPLQTSHAALFALAQALKRGVDETPPHTRDLLEKVSVLSKSLYAIENVQTHLNLRTRILDAQENPDSFRRSGCDLVALCGGVAAASRPFLAKLGFRLLEEYECDSLRCAVNAPLLTDALYCLLVDSAQALQDSGCDGAEVRVRLSVRKETVFLSVRDDGPGFGHHNRRLHHTVTVPSELTTDAEPPEEFPAGSSYASGVAELHGGRFLSHDGGDGGGGFVQTLMFPLLLPDAEPLGLQDCLVFQESPRRALSEFSVLQGCEDLYAL
jgi:K+-sensing histidine kinase KdpD